MSRCIAPLLLFLVLAQSALAAVPMNCQPLDSDPPCHSAQDAPASSTDVDCELRCGQCVSSPAMQARAIVGHLTALGYSAGAAHRYFPPDLVKGNRPPISG